MTSRSRMAWLALAVVLVAGAGFALFPRKPAMVQAVGATDTAPAPEVATDEPGPPPVSVSPAREAGPLPSMNAPLAEILPELERRAAAGDAAAACRIAAERGSCGWLRAQREHHLAWAAGEQRKFEQASANASPAIVAQAARQLDAEMSRREAQLEASESRCAGIEAPRPAHVAADWRRAAQLGSPSAMRYWASGQAIQPNGVLDALDELAAYRAGAPAMARQLVRDGDLAMTLAMANATAPLSSRTMSLLGQAVEEDAALSLALYRRALAALETTGDGYAAGLAAGVRERIEVISGLMPPQQLAEAARRELDFADWAPVKMDRIPNTLNARGQGILALAVHCQAEAGEPLPEDFRVNRRRATPL